MTKAKSAIPAPVAPPAQCIVSSAHTVAFLIRGDETYGVRQGTLTLLHGLREAGWCAPVLSLQEGVTAQTCADQGFTVRILGLDLPRRPDGGVWSKLRHHFKHSRAIGYIGQRLAEGLREVHADAIHVRWPDLVTVAGRAATACGVPCLWHLPTVIRGGDRLFSVSAMFYQWCCWHYRVTPMANSMATAATLGRWPVRPRVLYLGVDNRRFDPATVVGITRQTLGIPHGAVVLGMFGRVVPEKGHARVLEAMLTLGEHEGDLHLLVVGGPQEGRFVSELREIATQHAAEDRLHIVGSVGDPEKYYGVVDVAVNAFLGSEGFGISVVEAMMMGKPVLVHACGGPAETVADGVTGWHIAAPTPAVIATGIRRALGDYHRWGDMGKSARATALDRFSIQAFCREYIGIVRHATMQTSSPKPLA